MIKWQWKKQLLTHVVEGWENLYWNWTCNSSLEGLDRKTKKCIICSTIWFILIIPSKYVLSVHNYVADGGLEFQFDGIVIQMTFGGRQDYFCDLYNL